MLLWFLLRLPSNVANKESGDTSVEVSGAQPRFKFTISFNKIEKCMFMQTIKDEKICIHASQIETIVFFPKPEDCNFVLSSGKKKIQKCPSSLVLLVFKNHANPKNILFQKKLYNQICFQLPPYLSFFK